MHSWEHRETPRITGLESGCRLSSTPAPPFSLPEPSLLSRGPLPPATASPARHRGPRGAVARLWACSVLGPCGNWEGARGCASSPHSPAAQRQTSHTDPLPTARTTRCPSSTGFMGGRTPSRSVLRPPGLVAKSIRVRRAWIRPGFAICQLVPSGKFPGRSEPQWSDLQNSLPCM